MITLFGLCRERIDALYISLSGAGYGKGIYGVVAMVEPLVPVLYAFDGTVVDFPHLGESSGAVAFPVEVVQDVQPHTWRRYAVTDPLVA